MVWAGRGGGEEGEKRRGEVLGEALRYGNVLGLVQDHCLQMKFCFA